MLGTIQTQFSIFSLKEKLIYLIIILMSIERPSKQAVQDYLKSIESHNQSTKIKS